MKREVVALPRTLRTRHEKGIVPEQVEALRKQGRVKRRPANVQASNHPQDPDSIHVTVQEARLGRADQ